MLEHLGALRSAHTVYLVFPVRYVLLTVYLVFPVRYGLLTQCISVCRMVPTANSDCFPKLH
jgi:hypothetical protein